MTRCPRCGTGYRGREVGEVCHHRGCDERLARPEDYRVLASKTKK